MQCVPTQQSIELSHINFRPRTAGDNCLVTSLVVRLKATASDFDCLGKNVVLSRAVLDCILHVVSALQPDCLDVSFSKVANDESSSIRRYTLVRTLHQRFSGMLNLSVSTGDHQRLTIFDLEFLHLLSVRREISNKNQ